MSFSGQGSGLSDRYSLINGILSIRMQA